LIFVFYALSFVALTLTHNRLELSVAYAIWVGVDTALITLIGFMYLQEQTPLLKAACMGLIVIGVVALNYSVSA
jgi:small multidrug resistance pump